MGGQASTQLPVCRPSYPGQWTTQGKTQYCEIVRNNFTHEIAQQYSVPTPNNTTYQKNLGLYQHRRTHYANTVRVYHIEKQQGNYLCQGQDFLKVRTERIPFRLSDKNTILQHEAIKIIQVSLLGYKELFEYWGGFYINDDMIGFTQNEQAKVWINANFAINTPQNSHGIGNKVVSQSDLINQIFSVVEEHLESKNFSNSFKDKVLRKYPKSFIQAINLIQSLTSPSILSVSQVVSPQFNQQSTLSSQSLLQHQQHSNSYQQTSLPSYQTSQKYIQQQVNIPQIISTQINQSINNQLINNYHRSINSNILPAQTQNPVVFNSRGLIEQRTTSQIPQQKSQTLLMKSRIQDIKQPIPFKQVEVVCQRNLKTQRSFIGQRLLQPNQSYLQSSKIKQSKNIDNDETLRRPSLNNNRVINVQYHTKTQSANSITKNKAPQIFKKQSYQSKTYSSQSLSKQLKFNQTKLSQIKPLRHSPERKKIVPISQNIHSTNYINNISNISSNTIQTNKSTQILPRDININVSLPSNLASSKVVTHIQKQDYKNFPKPSLAVQRMIIEKIDKPSDISSLSQKQMINALNGISAIEYENNKTISKLSTEQIPLIVEINKLPSSVPFDSVNPQIRKIMTSPSAKQTVLLTNSPLPSTYQYEFQQHKSSNRLQLNDSPNNYEIKGARNITTPRFQYNSKQQSNSSVMSSRIQKLIQQHEADKQQLLKRIQQYERSSKFNKATYDTPIIQKVNTNNILKGSKASSNDYVVIDLYNELDQSKNRNPRY